MVGNFTIVYSIRFDCPPSQLEPLCCVPLPHQSPLGKYEGMDYQPTEYWPANFVCLRHGVACVRSPEDVRSDLEVRGPGAPVPPLWRITSICAHRDCGRRHIVYASRLLTWTEVARRILKLSPKFPCGDHELEWRKDLMRGTAFAHD